MTLKYQKTGGQKTQSIRQTCSVDGCLSEANRVKYQLCEKHYARKRRTGTTDKYEAAIRRKNSNGYITRPAKSHPIGLNLSDTSRIYEHRIVYYDHHGAGPYDCHWCGKMIAFDNMHVDHINSVKDDNRIENLVASCPACNKARGVEKMRKTQRSKGIMIEFNGVKKHVSEWADDLGISSVSLKNRINSGWELSRALTQPRGNTGPRRKSNAT
jgi:5-methylcytosine-specific restriction endonuclease McrA